MTTIPRIRRVKIENCRSIRAAEVALPESGLVLVQGRNRDTGGSSAAGKSSLIIAIQYALDCAPFPATHLKTLGAEGDLRVTLDIDGADGSFEVSRGPTTWLRSAGGPKVTSAKAVQEELRRRVGFTPSVLGVLTYRAQDHDSPFLSMTNEERSGFLCDVVPSLTAFEAVAAKATETAAALHFQHEVAQLKWERADAVWKAALAERREVPPEDFAELEAGVLVAKRALTRVENALARSRQALVELQAEETKVTVEAALVVHPGVQELQDELAQLVPVEFPEDAEVARLEKAEQECSTRLERAQRRDREAVAEHQCQRRDIDVKLSAAEKKVLTGQFAERKVRDLEAQVEKAQDHKCYACFRPLDDGLQDHLDELEAKLHQAAAEVETGKSAAERVVQLRDELAALTPPAPTATALERTLGVIRQQRQSRGLFVRQEFVARGESQRARRAELESSIATLNTEARADLLRKLEGVRTDIETVSQRAERAAADVSVADRAVHQAMDDLCTAQRAHAHAQAAAAEVERRVAVAAGVRQHAQEALQAAQVAHALEADVADLFGRNGFLGVIFDELLADFARETNEALAEVPNTQRVTVSFSTEMKGGRRAIVPVVALDGDASLPMRALLSGGMARVVMLAIDLSVTSVLCRRHGRLPGWLFIDEGLHGLGRVEKEAALELLRRFGRDRLIVVTDHATEFQELFSQTIVVECENGVSRIC